MSAQPAVRVDDLRDDEMLDVETSAAILRWMETALVPDGVDPNAWERWLDAGCKGRIEARKASAPATRMTPGDPDSRGVNSSLLRAALDCPWHPDEA
jgi:hypothetical protein